MVAIPEILIQKVLVQGFTNIKQDPRLLDFLFQNMSQAQLNDLKNYILGHSIDFSVNYPKKEALNVPAIVLVMKGESEAETFLGDFAGYSTDPGVPDQDVMIDTLGGHGGSTSSLGNLGAPLIQGLSVAGYSASGRITLAEEDLPDYYEVYEVLLSGECHAAYVVSGTGAGQVALITSVSSNSIDIVTPFSVELDTTSVVDIRSVNDLATEGEPSRVYDPNVVYERLGVHYDVQYQLQIIAGHQDEVIYLYSIVKALLLSQRPFLEGQGMMVFKLSGSDFAPRGEYLPSDCFMRVLNIQFTYPFTFIQEVESASSIQVTLLADELGSPGNGVPILIGPITVK